MSLSEPSWQIQNWIQGLDIYSIGLSILHKIIDNFDVNYIHKDIQLICFAGSLKFYPEFGCYYYSRKMQIGTLRGI